jgi:hypothetical protein
MPNRDGGRMRGWGKEKPTASATVGFGLNQCRKLLVGQALEVTPRRTFRALRPLGPSSASYSTVSPSSRVL